MIVYHGSPVDIINEVIEPRQAFNLDIYSKGVYVTTDKITALLYSVNPIKSYFINHNVNLDASAFTSHIEFGKYPIKVYELYEGMFDELFNKKGYIYTADEPEEDLISTESSVNEFFIERAVKIIDKIVIDNVWKEICNLSKSNIIEIIYYKNWDGSNRRYFFDRYVETRAEFCKTEEELKFFLDKFKIKGKIK